MSTSESHVSSSDADTPAGVRTDQLAPTPRLSSRGLSIALLMTCLLPLCGLSLYAVLFGRAAQHTLDVNVQLDRRAVPAVGGGGAFLTEVVVIENQSDHDIPNLTVDLNGQYFLYQDAPLSQDDTLVVPQNIFATKSNQRFVPGRYPITDVTVTGRLPSGARGVTETLFDPETGAAIDHE
ncbi:MULTISPECIES: hypothetical protein [Crateriforma]|uniref:Uncharacterized protein n=1 Tax=Crateriforma conspicua TaxID=2527996 RepID=A0A5C6FY93_9PLAN|nr:MULTISPECIES: hypothetical protein [Crateriforma]TWU66308.1 hypothetical protein V7x_18720 [Crateriforma conspicua]